MEALPHELIDRVRELRPRHPTAVIVADFYRRIGYSGHGSGTGEEDECLWFCLADYKAEPDHFDARHDGKRGCVSAFYGWGDECSDMRLHGLRR